MTHSKASLFLMELITAILFFSIASAVCIQLFVKSHLLSEQSMDTNHAVLHAQNLAECWLAAEGDIDAVATFFPEGACRPAEPQSMIFSSEILELYFDEDWNPIETGEAFYCAAIANIPAAKDERGLSNLRTAQIRICRIPDGDGDARDARIIYELKLEQHAAARLSELSADNSSEVVNP